jgi:hypothetical protein
MISVRNQDTVGWGGTNGFASKKLWQRRGGKLLLFSASDTEKQRHPVFREAGRIYSDFQNYWDFGLCPSCGILKTREYKISETLCFFLCVFFRIPDDGQSPKNPVFLSVIHHRQNPLESTYW